MTIARRFFAVLALALVGILGLASPAMAAPPTSCTNSSVCGYGRHQFSTAEGYELSPVRSAGTCENLGLRNQWTSVYNNSGRTIRMYKNTGCGGGHWELPSGDSLRNMALYQPSWNDNIESIMFR